MSLHLLHHIADGIKEQGPVHSWSMYVYERFNSWICQRAMNRLHPEATVMETYRVSYYHYRLFFNFMTILYKINGTVKPLNTLVALRQICLAVVDGFPEQAKNVAIVDGMVDVNVRFECTAFWIINITYVTVNESEKPNDKTTGFLSGGKCIF